MPNVLQVSWSITVRTDAGVIRRAGTDLDTLGDTIDDLEERGLCDFYTAQDGDEDDGDDDLEDATELDDLYDEPPAPPIDGPAPI